MSTEINKYHNYPFCEISRDAFYTYASVEELLKVCEQHKTKLLKCRTLGILSSINGCFYLKDINLPLYKANSSIRVSMVYLKESLKSTVLSQAVQIFGTLEWKNDPIIIVKILQELTIPMAIKLNDAIHSIAAQHIVKQVNNDQKEI